MKTTCLYCQKEYETKRDSSAYCSNSCRTGAYKYRKRVEQFEAENQKVLQGQKEAADKQKLIEDELRNQKAEKRRKTKADKALKASLENEKLTNENSQVEATKPELELPPENNLQQQEQPEKIADLPQISSTLTVQQRLELIKKSNSERTKQPTFWDFVNEMAKHYNNRNK